MYKILIADDEPDIVAMLKDHFEMEKYLVLTAYSGSEVIEKIKHTPDIILLDINMPDIDGLNVCKKIREHISCPIVFLTARIEDADKIRGFAAGGDDYMTKPFSIDELSARVMAHIRREQRVKTKSNVRFFGNVTIDYTSKIVTVNNKVLELAKKEYQILELLTLNCGQIFDKERIYEKIWGYDAQGDSSVIAEHIRRLRQKLSAYGEEQHIETVWGMGYKWKK